MIKFSIGFILGAVLLYFYPGIGEESISIMKEVLNGF
jgi:hypothetical protein|tara:strand:- start:705 stop:815 length:111 start_codon:yes stop_codon:yes gene_type:complete